MKASKASKATVAKELGSRERRQDGQQAWDLHPCLRGFTAHAGKVGGSPHCGMMA